MRPIIFATGNVYKFAAKRCTGKVTQNARLDVIRERQPRIDGVELTFTRPETVLEFRPSPDNLVYLQSLGHNTIHAPYRHYFDDSPLSRSILVGLQSVYEQIGAKRMVFHGNNVASFEWLLENFPYAMDIENSEYDGRRVTENLRKVLELHRELGLTLDASHALLIDRPPSQRLMNLLQRNRPLLQELIDAFRERIRYVHLSTVWGFTKSGLRDHRPLIRSSKRNLAALDPVRELDDPIIIEESLLPGEESLILEEVDFVREWISG